MDVLNKVLHFFKFHFGRPKNLNWGYPLMLSTLGVLLVLIIRKVIGIGNLPFSLTSLVSNGLVIPVLTIVSLILPAVMLCGEESTPVTGRYTGVGTIILSFLSGIPMMLVNSSTHNIMAWIWLKISNKMVYPAFFYYAGSKDALSTCFAIITDTVIPAFGIALFFYGLVWSRFKFENRTWAIIIITVAFTLYSLNFVDIIGIAVAGWWLCMLRDRMENIWGPFAALIGMRLTELIFGGVLKEVDVTTIQTYSDIHSSYFYASIPSLFVAMILFMFFMKTMNDFSNLYNSDIYGADGEDALMEKHYQSLPSFVKGLNPALIVAVITIVVIWVLMFKGVWL